MYDVATGVLLDVIVLLCVVDMLVDVMVGVGIEEVDLIDVLVDELSAVVL